MPPKDDEVATSEEALQARLLAELQQLKDEATEEDTDADAWNVIKNTTPEELTATLMGLLASYTELTVKYSAFTKEGHKVSNPTQNLVQELLNSEITYETSSSR